LPGHVSRIQEVMHICSYSWAIEICKNIRIRTCFGLVTVDSAEISFHFAILRHGIKLAIFLIACLKCNFEGTSFELIKYLVTLIPEKSRGFYLTLLYYCYTLPTRAAYTTNTHREKERRRVSSANTVSSIQTYKSVMPHIYEYRDFPRHPTHTAL